ncbi:MAG: hypothetical protein HOK62_02595, partial [Verrucomicrobiales bacterium]|nr:hypothetical protein [Verrucomicrobiales bacterium]
MIGLQEAHGLAFEKAIPAGSPYYHKIANALFMSVSTRTAGLNTVDTCFLSLATNFLMMCAMFLASTPTVVVMRYSVEGSLVA